MPGSVQSTFAGLRGAATVTRSAATPARARMASVRLNVSPELGGSSTITT